MRFVLGLTAGVRAMTPRIRSLMTRVTHQPCRQGDLCVAARGDFSDLCGCATGRLSKIRRIGYVETQFLHRLIDSRRQIHDSLLSLHYLLAESSVKKWVPRDGSKVALHPTVLIRARRLPICISCACFFSPTLENKGSAQTILIARVKRSRHRARRVGGSENLKFVRNVIMYTGMCSSPQMDTRNITNLIFMVSAHKENPACRGR